MTRTLRQHVVGRTRTGKTPDLSAASGVRAKITLPYFQRFPDTSKNRSCPEVEGKVVELLALWISRKSMLPESNRHFVSITAEPTSLIEPEAPRKHSQHNALAVSRYTLPISFALDRSRRVTGNKPGAPAAQRDHTRY